MKSMPTRKTSWPIFLRSDVDAIDYHRVAIGDLESNIITMLGIFVQFEQQGLVDPIFHLFILYVRTS